MELIGRGNTADVYAIDNNKVLKLFHKDYPKEVAEHEYRCSLAVNNLNFTKPKAYELITQDGCNGIIYDRVDGISLLDWVLETQDIKGCAAFMANIHKQILSNHIDNVPDYKELLYVFTKQATQDDEEKQRTAQKKVDDLEDGDVLCHGDLHPGNIIIKDGKATIIDFMNICHGSRLYDIARTVYLVQYTPIDENSPMKDQMLEFKRQLAEAYLQEMNVRREDIMDYLRVIALARTAECPIEQYQLHATLE